MVLLNTCWWLGSWNRCFFFSYENGKAWCLFGTVRFEDSLKEFRERNRLQVPSSSFIQYCSLPPFLVCPKKSCTHFVPQSFGGDVFSKNLNVNLAKKIKSKRKTATLINSFVYRDIFMWSVWMIHSLSPGRHKKFRFFIKVKIQLMQISGRIGDGFLPFS